MTIEESNKVIGEFMGYRMFPKRFPRNHGIGAPESEWKDMIIEKAKYHKSWDALMPVVKKINETLKGETRDGSFVNPHRMMEALKDCNIELVHYSAVKCIEWFNKNPKV